MSLPFDNSEEPSFIGDNGNVVPHRICNKCMEYKPITEFHKDKGRRDALKRHPVCNKCLKRHQQVVSKIRKTAPPKPTVCECCGRNPDIDTTIRGWAMDHNHITEEFRGWICQTCNIGLGHFKDSVEGLTKAIDYLEQTNKRTNDENQ
jgi:hypothetical protein